MHVSWWVNLLAGWLKILEVVMYFLIFIISYVSRMREYFEIFPALWWCSLVANDLRLTTMLVWKTYLEQSWWSAKCYKLDIYKMLMTPSLQFLTFILSWQLSMDWNSSNTSVPEGRVNSVINKRWSVCVFVCVCACVCTSRHLFPFVCSLNSEEIVTSIATKITFKN